MATKPMNGPPPMQLPPQMGGMRNSVLDEIQEMAGHFLLLSLVLLSVYVSRVPPAVLAYFRRPVYQMIGFITIIIITARYGWIHGILGALAFALLVSRSLRQRSEGMTDFLPLEPDPNVFIIEDSTAEVVPKGHRWFLEKVMGETPILIQEKEVNTSAIQDMSEKSMGSSTVTK
jgi:hypothetical protein